MTNKITCVNIVVSSDKLLYFINICIWRTITIIEHIRFANSHTFTLCGALVGSSDWCRSCWPHGIIKADARFDEIGAEQSRVCKALM